MFFQSGEVVFKENFGSSVAGLTMGDYRMDGRLELIACSTEGELRGYLPASSDGQNKESTIKESHLVVPNNLY